MTVITSKGKLKKCRSAIKLLKASVNSWESRFVQMESKYEISIASHETKISKMENKLKTLKAKLKVGHRKLKTMESKINDIQVVNLEASPVVTPVPETVSDDKSTAVPEERDEAKKPKTKKQAKRMYAKLDADDGHSSQQVVQTQRNPKRTKNLQILDVKCKRVRVLSESQEKSESGVKSRRQVTLEKASKNNYIIQEEKEDHDLNLGIIDQEEGELNENDDPADHDYVESAAAEDDDESSDKDNNKSRNLPHPDQNIDSEEKVKKKVKIPDESLPKRETRSSSKTTTLSRLTPLKTTPLRLTPLKCNYCPKVYYKRPALEKHVSTHSEHKKIEQKCPLCDEILPDGQWNINEHLKLHKKSTTLSLRKGRSSSNGSGNFICPVCLIRFTREDHFKDHQKLHTKQQEKGGKNNNNDKEEQKEKDKKEDTKKSTLQCPRCDRIFGNRPGFSKHFKLCQKDATCYKCSKCDRQFYRQDKLQAHLRCHTGEVKSISCPTCQKAFTRTDTLKIHIQAQHTERTKSVKCDKCQVSFYTAKDLRRHKKTMKHLRRTGCLPGETFECLLCPLEFSTQQGLLTHLGRHTKNQD